MVVIACVAHAMSVIEVVVCIFFCLTFQITKHGLKFAYIPVDSINCMQKRLTFFICLLFIFSASYSQGIYIGVFGGLAAYNGDLTDKIFPRKVTNGVIGITAGYELTEQLMLRGGFSYSVVGGADRYSDKQDLRMRNLSFETQVAEFSILGDYSLFDLSERKISPYGFAGIAVFKFDPYTYDATGTKVFLQRLSTEGQGITGYNSKPYKLTQMAIPFGGGARFAVNDNIRIGLELSFRKLFTDYLDDVSTVYADPVDLLAAKGPLAVELSYRGDEVSGGNPVFPAKGAQRGSPESNDSYYFAGLHLTYRIGAGEGGGYGRTGGSRRNKNGCPVNVY